MIKRDYQPSTKDLTLGARPFESEVPSRASLLSVDNHSCPTKISLHLFEIVVSGLGDQV